MLELMLSLVCYVGVIILIGLIDKASPVASYMGSGCVHDCRRLCHWC